MKKICFFISSMENSGGTERMVALISNALTSSDFSVYILILKGKNSFFSIHNDIVLKNLMFDSNRNFLKTIWKIKKFISQEQIDVLIDVDTVLSFFSFFATLGTKVRSIGWEHFNYLTNINNKKRYLSRRIGNLFYDDVIVLTEKDKYFWEKSVLNRARITVIKNPIPFDMIDIDKRKNYEKREKIVLSIGRFSKQKGFDELIKSWSLICNSFPEWKLFIVGDGEEKEGIKELIEKKKIKNSVFIFNSTNEIEKFYSMASVYCLSSRYEGLPMVLIEALYYGLPIVAYDCNTGPADIVVDKVNGFLCEPLNYNLLANKLMELISNDSLMRSFSEKSFILSKQFSMSEVLSQWHDLINDK